MLQASESHATRAVHDKAGSRARAPDDDCVISVARERIGGGNKHWAKLKRKSTLKKVSSTEFREFIGHNAEHQAQHRLAEKVTFAFVEHGIAVVEAIVARVADSLRLRKLAAAAPERRALLARVFRRRAPAPPPPPPSALDAVVRALPEGALALVKVCRCVVPAAGMFLLLHMARADKRRAIKEWREKRHAVTTALFGLAALCDSLDALVHAVVLFAHADYGIRGGHLVSHHALHDLESTGIQLAAVAFLAMCSGEIISNNRTPRKRAVGATDTVVHHHKSD